MVGLGKKPIGGCQGRLPTAFPSASRPAPNSPRVDGSNVIDCQSAIALSQSRLSFISRDSLPCQPASSPVLARTVVAGLPPICPPWRCAPIIIVGHWPAQTIELWPTTAKTSNVCAAVDPLAPAGLVTLDHRPRRPRWPLPWPALTCLLIPGRPPHKGVRPGYGQGPTGQGQQECGNDFGAKGNKGADGHGVGTGNGHQGKCCLPDRPIRRWPLLAALFGRTRN